MPSRPTYAAADIDVTSAQRQAAEGLESFTSFTSIRALTSGAGALTVGARSGKPGSAGLLDFYYETDTYWLYYYSGTKWLFLTGLNYGTNATRAAITVTANDNGASYFTTDTGKLWRVVAGAWADQFTTIELTTAVKIASNQIIGTRKAAVNDVASADATDLATVLLVANETKAQLNAWLARARAATGHGLIA